MHPELVEMEARFANAILDRTASVPASIRDADSIRAARALEVHRNNFRVNLREALQVTYPVTAQLVGEEFFAVMITAYVEARPPRSPVLIDYGNDLPEFIDQFPPAASVPYLGDVARLEAAWSDAYHARDGASLSLSALGALEPETLAGMRIELHPSLRLLRSRYPVASIWSAHQPGAGEAVSRWEAEDVLVVRPEAEVMVIALEPGQLTMFSGLAKGLDVATASALAADDDAGFDTGKALVALFSAGAVATLSSR
jgi:hypothetical protein